jgi:hypothetical protein
MKYRPVVCVKCGGDLPSAGPRGGRPSRFCSDGCKLSVEAELRRLTVHLRKAEEGGYWDRLNYDEVKPRRQQVIDDLQRRFDFLAGVPQRSDDDDLRRLDG